MKITGKLLSHAPRWFERGVPVFFGWLGILSNAWFSAFIAFEAMQPDGSSLQGMVELLIPEAVMGWNQYPWWILMGTA